MLGQTSDLTAGGTKPENQTIKSAAGGVSAANAQAGVELWQRSRFALDLRGRYSKFQTGNFSTSAGFTGTEDRAKPFPRITTTLQSLARFHV
jgi:hypothetical protein